MRRRRGTTARTHGSDRDGGWRHLQRVRRRTPCAGPRSEQQVLSLEAAPDLAWLPASATATPAVLAGSGMQEALCSIFGRVQVC